MECGICFDYFDSVRHRPKVLVPCGHLYCLACLQGLENRRCPMCQEEFTIAAERLPDNLNLLTLSETIRSDLQRRLWCCECKSVARQVCRDMHILRSTKAVLNDAVKQLQMQAEQLANDLLEPLRLDDDDAREQALHVLELAQQPRTTLEVSVRGQRGEAFTATWTSPPSSPAGLRGAAEAVEAVTTKVLVLALAKKGLWQQRGEQGRGEAAGQDGARGQDKDEAQGGAAPDLPPKPGALNVEKFPTTQRKAELLQTVTDHGVRKLGDVWCDVNPDWSMQLLQHAGPHVEELVVYEVRNEHFLAVLAMPKLRRLVVGGHSEDQSLFPAELPPLSPNQVGLRWLRVYLLPLETTFSLIRRHAGTLEELWLTVGTPGGPRWLRSLRGYEDLHVALRRCGLARLKRLVLWRHSQRPHDAQVCPAQLSEVRGALPGVQVQCNECDNVACNFWDASR